MILIFGATVLAGALVSGPLLGRGKGMSPAGLERVERLAGTIVFPVLLVGAIWVVLRLYTPEYLRVLAIVAALPLLILLLVSLRKSGTNWRWLPQLTAGVTLFAVAGTETVLANAAAGGFPSRFPALLAQLVGQRAVFAHAASLKNSDPQIRAQAAEELSKLHPAALSREAAQAGTSPDAPWIIAKAAALKEVTPVAASILASAISDRDDTVRQHAAQALARQPDSRYHTALCGLLRDPNSETRKHARTALGSLADPAAIPALIAALAEQESLDERRELVRSLRMIGGPVIPELDRLLADEDSSIRLAAVDVLGETWSGPSTLLLLQTARKDPDPRVRTAALRKAAEAAATSRRDEVHRLVSLKNGFPVGTDAREYVDPNLVIQSLVIGARDQDPMVREQATKGISEIRAADAYIINNVTLDLNDPDNELTPIDSRPVVAALGRSLLDPAKPVRLAAATSLGNHTDRRAVPALIRSLALTDDGATILYLAEAIAKAGDVSAIPALRAADARHKPRSFCDLCKALYKLGARDGLRHQVLIVRGE